MGDRKAGLICFLLFCGGARRTGAAEPDQAVLREAFNALLCSLPGALEESHGLNNLVMSKNIVDTVNAFFLSGLSLATSVTPRVSRDATDAPWAMAVCLAYGLAWPVWGGAGWSYRLDPAVHHPRCLCVARFALFQLRAARNEPRMQLPPVAADGVPPAFLQRVDARLLGAANALAAVAAEEDHLRV